MSQEDFDFTDSFQSPLSTGSSGPPFNWLFSGSPLDCSGTFSTGSFQSPPLNRAPPPPINWLFSEPHLNQLFSEPCSFQIPSQLRAPFQLFRAPLNWLPSFQGPLSTSFFRAGSFQSPLLTGSYQGPLLTSSLQAPLSSVQFRAPSFQGSFSTGSFQSPYQPAFQGPFLTEPAQQS